MEKIVAKYCAEGKNDENKMKSSIKQMMRSLKIATNRFKANGMSLNEPYYYLVKMLSFH